VNKILVLVVSGIFTLIPFCHADTLTAVDLDEVITLSPGGVELRLKGAATKSNARQAIYVGGLYLQNDAQSVQDVLDSAGAKRFIIKTNEMIKPAAIIRAINLGITVNHNQSELEVLSPLMKQFNRIWSTEINQGDEICIDFEPTQGTLISINGIQKGIIPGTVFYTAFLKTWIGDKPLNPAIKKQLMGQN
jgi:chalcone isomerase-like protein